MKDNNIHIKKIEKTSETLDILNKNIPRYIEYIKKYLKDNFDQNDKSLFDVSDYSSDYFHYNNEDEFYYYIKIMSNEFKAYSIHSIFNGPIKKLYELDGIADIRIKNSTIIEIIYHVPFFLQEELFKSFKAVDKFNL